LILWKQAKGVFRIRGGQVEREGIELQSRDILEETLPKLEVSPDSKDFMDKMLHADDAEHAEVFLNDVVDGNGCWMFCCLQP